METPMLTPQRKGSSAWEWVVKSRLRAPHPASHCDPCWSVVSLHRWAKSEMSQGVSLQVWMHGSQTYHSLRVGVLKGKFPQLSRSSKYSTILSILMHTPLIQFFSSPVFCLGRLQSTSWIFWRPRAEFEHQGTSGLCSFGKFKISNFDRFQQISTEDFNRFQWGHHLRAQLLLAQCNSLLHGGWHTLPWTAQNFTRCWTSGMDGNDHNITTVDGCEILRQLVNIPFIRLSHDL